MRLDAFNDSPRAEAREALRPCVDIDRWLDAVVDARPYASLGDALASARNAADPWTEAEVDRALAHHPRIGERAGGSHAALSRDEQAGVDGADVAIAAALADGNRAYEERFGRVFLIRAAGRSGSEILAALQARMLNSPEQEFPVVAGQLREIALLRMEGILGG